MTDTNQGGWVVDDSSFGARLALIRHRMGWNVKQAARECGQAAATWRTWELDGAEPRNRIDVAEKIAARTGCDFGWLLVGPRLGRDIDVATINGTRKSTHNKMRTPTSRVHSSARTDISDRATVRTGRKVGPSYPIVVHAA